MGIVSIRAAQASGFITSWGSAATLALITLGGIIAKLVQLVGQVKDLKTTVGSHATQLKQITESTVKSGVEEVIK